MCESGAEAASWYYIKQHTVVGSHGDEHERQEQQQQRAVMHLTGEKRSGPDRSLQEHNQKNL